MVKIAYVDISCVDETLYSRLFDMADAQRKCKALRYLRFEDKVRCVSAGALLRYAAAKQLGTDTFETATDDNGKPHIVGAGDFHFNLSHAGKWVVITYGNTPVGIDVEKIDPATAVSGIASRFYTSDEQNYVADNTERFFEVWTAKESYIKFVGKGLQMGLTSFSVLSIKGPHFYPISIDPQYRMTLCATEAPQWIEQIPISSLI